MGKFIYTLTWVVSVLFNFIFFLLLAIVTGLWWLPRMIPDAGVQSSFLRASVYLLISLVVFHKHIFKARHRRSPLYFYFFSTLVGLGIIGYLYGIFRVFL